MAVFKDKYTNTWATKFRYTDFDGVNKQKKKTGFATKKEASEFEKDFIAKKANTADITFKGLYDYYISDCEARMKPATLLGKKKTFKAHLLPYFGKFKLTAITPVTVRTWQNELINSGKYADTYLRRLHVELTAIFNFACKLFGLKVNPCRGAGNMGKSKSGIKNFWKPEEFNKFITAFEDKPMSKTGFTILFYSGIRIGELLALTAEDFNFSDNTMRINKNYVRIAKVDYIQTPKTEKSNRVITMPPAVMNMVKEYMFSLYDYKKTDRLFPVTEFYFLHDMNKGSAKAGVKKIRLHDIRHSHASMLMDMDVPIKQISERLGHENIETTLSIYAHMYDDKENVLASKLEEMALKMAIV